MLLTTVMATLLAGLPQTPSKLEVLVLPVAPQDGALAPAVAPLARELETAMGRLRGVRSFRVRQESVMVRDEGKHSAMNCDTVECAADLASSISSAEALLATLTHEGAVSRLALVRVDARTAREVARVQRFSTPQHEAGLAPQVAAMVHELFPEMAPPVLLPSRVEPITAAVLEAAREQEPQSTENASWLVPPALGGGLTLGMLGVLGAVPFLLSTVGLVVGSVYLLNILHGALLKPAEGKPEGRIMMQGVVMLTLLWPAIMAAPLALMAPGVTLLTTFVAWWVPKYLFARKPLPLARVVLATMVPVCVASLLLFLPLGGSALAAGAYVAPWAAEQSPKLAPYWMGIVVAAILGVGAGAALGFAGAAVASWGVAFSALTVVPAVVAVSLGWDQRPLHDEERKMLPVDEILRDAEGGSSHSLR